MKEWLDGYFTGIEVSQNRELEDKVYLLEQLSGKSLDELIAFFHKEHELKKPYRNVDIYFVCFDESDIL